VVHGRAGRVRLGFGEICDRRLGEHEADGTRRVAEDARRSRADRAIEQLDKLEHRQFVGWTGERVAPLHTTLRAQDPSPAQHREQLLQELCRNLAATRKLGDRNRPVVATLMELNERTDRIRRLSRDRDHSLIIARATARLGNALPSDLDAGGAAWACHPLYPTSFGRDQDGLRAIHRAELPVHVVQMRSHRARREPELAGDLLVDHPLREAAKNVDLAA
jgi:plasmid stabilization system protein ParE